MTLQDTINRQHGLPITFGASVNATNAAKGNIENIKIGKATFKKRLKHGKQNNNR